MIEIPLCRFVPFTSFDRHLLLIVFFQFKGNLFKKGLKRIKEWIKEATPICSEIAYALRMYVTSLHPAGVELSSDDDDTASDSHDGFSPILLPPGFQPASTPPHGKRLVPLETTEQQMIRQYTLFKWPTYGWCLDKREIVRGREIGGLGEGERKRGKERERQATTSRTISQGCGKKNRNCGSVDASSRRSDVSRTTRTQVTHAIVWTWNYVK